MALFLLQKSQKLLDKKDFSAVFDNPVRSADEYFTILAKPNSLAHSRLGITVAKKNLKRAHDRNLVKRLIRESFRLNQSELVMLDIVVMTKRNITEFDNHVLTNSLVMHWKRIVKRCKPA